MRFRYPLYLSESLPFDIVPIGEIDTIPHTLVLMYRPNEQMREVWERTKRCHVDLILKDRRSVFASDFVPVDFGSVASGSHEPPACLPTCRYLV